MIILNLDSLRETPYYKLSGLHDSNKKDTDAGTMASVDMPAV
jgi:hypothetical protein